MRERVRHVLVAIGLLVGGFACSARPDADLGRREPIVGLPCEGCEAVFEGLPTDVDWRTRIAAVAEPGERMQLEGTVRDAAGRVVGGVLVYAYHTDARGLYPRATAPPGPAAARHGRLRGWAKSDARGRYRFDTIRPAGYPDSDLPAHVHMHVLEPGRCTYYIDDLLFADDPRLTSNRRQAMTPGRGGDGVASPTQDARGTWRAVRDIVLGANIPGYPAREVGTVK